MFTVCPGKPADIVLMIDESSSIWPVHFAKLREFLVSLVDNFDIGEDQTRIAALTYSDRTTLRFGLNEYQTAEEMQSAIEAINQQGGGKRQSAEVIVLANCTIFQGLVAQ